MVWNENVLEFQGASWELIQMAHQRKTPCLWVSSKTGRTYWLQSAYYETFSPERLRQLICQEGSNRSAAGRKTFP